MTGSVKSWSLDGFGREGKSGGTKKERAPHAAMEFAGDPLLKEESCFFHFSRFWFRWLLALPRQRKSSTTERTLSPLDR